MSTLSGLQQTAPVTTPVTPRSSVSGYGMSNDQFEVREVPDLIPQQFMSAAGLTSKELQVRPRPISPGLARPRPVAPDLA